MIKKHRLVRATLLLIIYAISIGAQAAQIEVTGKHTRADGSTHDFEVIDGDALSPGDRFQIVIGANKATYYAILYFSRDGKAAQIFPVTGRVGRIRAGTKQHIPSIDNHFTLDINGGRELMFVVTAEHEISNLKSVLRGAESVGGSPAEIGAYLKKRLPQVQKLEITNTGKQIGSSTDQVSSSLVRDISATYAANPWTESAVSESSGRERVRRRENSDIPEAVRRRTAEVRSLLKRPRGTTGSSSLRTVQVDPSGEIRRNTDLLMAQKEKQAEAARLRQARLAQEERQRQEKIESAKLAREMAENEANRLQKEREMAERLQAQRQAEAEKSADELAAKRLAMAEAEAEAERRAELRAEEERQLAEQKRLQEERITAEETGRLEAQRLAELDELAESRRLERQRLEAEEAARLDAERKALAVAEAEAQRIEQERALAEQQRQNTVRAEAEAKQLAEQRAAEETQRQAEETRRQAEIMAEEESIRAEQQALDEKLRQQQQLAEQQAEENADKEKESDSGFFGKMMAFVSGDSAEKPGAKSTTVIQTDGDEEVVLNEAAEDRQIEYVDNNAAEAPRPAVVALQAPARPAAKVLSAPAPVRVKLAEGEAAGASGEAAAEHVAQIASAIVSISTSNDSQAAGFILDSKGHILTGWHVINGVTDIDVSFMAVSGNQRTYKALVIKYDKFHDLALLKLVDPPEGIQPITVSGNELPDAGATVRVFGQKDGQIWATDDAVITRIAPHFTWFSRDNVIHRGEVLQVDLPSEGKDIGSLVTTMDYQMLGVKSFSGSQTGRTYAVSVRTIRDFVEERGVAASKATPQ